MSEISFIDTTLRNRQQSLRALGIKTDAMLGGAAQMDRVGFASRDFFVSIMIKNMSELEENRWIWVCEGINRFRHTRLRNHGGLHGSGAMEKLPHAERNFLPKGSSVTASRLPGFRIVGMISPSRVRSAGPRGIAGSSVALSSGRIPKNISAILAGGIRAADLFTAHTARLASSYEISPDDHQAKRNEKQDVQ